MVCRLPTVKCFVGPVESVAKGALSTTILDWLEMMAQILSVAVAAPHAKSHLVCFIKHMASRRVL